MPKKFLPHEDDLARLKEELVDRGRGFFMVEGLQHLRRTRHDVRALAPRPQSGGELGFAFQNYDLTIIVWTTWVPAWRAAREDDSGWVVYEEQGRLRYALPVHRTKNFAKHLLMEAKIARLRVRLRPSCHTCQRRMMIAYGKGMLSRFWRCPFRHEHMPWDTKEFLQALPPEAMKHLRRRRRAHERWLEICRKAGKPIGAAVLRRRAWRVVSLPVVGF